MSRSRHSLPRTGFLLVVLLLLAAAGAPSPAHAALRISNSAVSTGDPLGGEKSIENVSSGGGGSVGATIATATAAPATVEPGPAPASPPPARRVLPASWLAIWPATWPVLARWFHGPEGRP